jgi:hypothetical protein
MASPTQVTLLAAAAMLLVGCASSPSQGTLNDVRAEANPSDRAQRNTTSFTPALRCMDDIMFRRGTRDITLMMEEMRDATQRVPISARDMMTSAMSDISRRSRGVRLSVFGTDQQNLIQFMQSAQKTSPFAVVPQYSVRGTVSQLDEGVEKSSATFGATLAENVFGVRFASDTRFAVMAMDAAVVQTDTMTLVPGVVSKNTTVLVSRDASAQDGQGRLVKRDIGLVFSLASSRADGPAQAARNMVELATVELVGRLIKAPYWQCLGIADTDPEVQRELDDWFFGMDEGERIQFYKARMRDSRHYDGTVDTQDDAAFRAALAGYRLALGLPQQGEPDQEFFKQVVMRAVPRRAVAVAAPVVPTAATATTATTATTALVPRPSAAPPMTLTLQVDRANTGRSVDLSVDVRTAGYVYCYTQNPQTGRIQRIFPNRFQHDPRVSPGQVLHLPGRDRFLLSKTAQYACIHAPQEVYADLPAQLRWGDFEDIRLNTFDEIQQQFAQASGLQVQLVRHTLPTR